VDTTGPLCPASPARRGERGKIVAWADTIVGQSILKGTPSNSTSGTASTRTSVEGAQDIPTTSRLSLRAPHTDAAVPVCRGARSGTPHTGYAVECFVDQLLQAAGKDPVAARLEMMQRTRRARRGVAAARLRRWPVVRPRPVDNARRA